MLNPMSPPCEQLHCPQPKQRQHRRFRHDQPSHSAGQLPDTRVVECQRQGTGECGRIQVRGQDQTDGRAVRRALTEPLFAQSMRG